ncbi:MAG: hypothetical protein HYX33_02170 [Actinobacteria bacterium]|nr:hypothetical protein [Actinomycetota bacterium]
MHHRITIHASRRRWRLRRLALGALGIAAVAALPAQARNVLSFQGGTPPLQGGGMPNGLSVDPFGTAWFVNTDASGIGSAIPDATGTLQFREELGGLALGDRPVDTAADGRNVWIALQGKRAIGRRRADASVSLEANGLLTAPAAQITVGTANTIWFTERSGTDRIGRITLNGDVATVKEFPITPGFAPDQIVALRDGTLMVSSFSGPSLMRITIGAGDVLTASTIPLPVGGSVATGLAADSKGNVWATQATANHVYRVTRASIVVDVKNLVGLVAPTGVTVDARDDVWIADPGARGVLRIVKGTTPLAVERTGLTAPTAIVAAPLVGGQPPLWVLDGSRVARGILAASGAKFVVAPNVTTTLRATIGKPVAFSILSSDAGTLNMVGRVGKRVCARVAFPIVAGPQTLTWKGGLAGGCTPKRNSAAARKALLMSVEFSGADIDANAIAAPKVNLVLSPAPKKKLV